MRIVAKNLIKVYGYRSVVNDVSFEVNKGEVVGLLGPNGAGKTTTFYMIVGLVKADSGEVFLENKKSTATKTSCTLKCRYYQCLQTFQRLFFIRFKRIHKSCL